MITVYLTPEDFIPLYFVHPAMAFERLNQILEKRALEVDKLMREASHNYGEGIPR